MNVCGTISMTGRAGAKNVVRVMHHPAHLETLPTQLGRKAGLILRIHRHVLTCGCEKLYEVEKREPNDEWQVPPSSSSGLESRLAFRTMFMAKEVTSLA